jgi:hypothetical protein
MKQSTSRTIHNHLGQIALSLLLASAAACRASENESDDWQQKAIAPVANPIYFEDPRIYSDVRPIFMYHTLPNNFGYAGGSVPLGGDVQVYALQLRLKLTDRLALIATKDGYIAFKPDHTLAHQYGWADLAAGLKYAVIDDRDNAFILTPGLTITIPTGSQDVFQSHGAGVWNLFASSEKGWGNLHLTGNLGFLIPNEFAETTSQLHYSLQLDYNVCQYFIPFVVGNGYTILTQTSSQQNQSLTAVPLNAEGYDLINFGACEAAGSTQLTLGGGLRSKLTKNFDIGAAYEVGVVSPKGIFENRVTVDIDFHW